VVLRDNTPSRGVIPALVLRDNTPARGVIPAFGNRLYPCGEKSLNLMALGVREGWTIFQNIKLNARRK